MTPENVWERMVSLQTGLGGIGPERCPGRPPVARGKDFPLAFLFILIEASIKDMTAFLRVFGLDRRK